MKITLQFDEMPEHQNQSTQPDYSNVAELRKAMVANNDLPILNDWSFGSALQNATHDYIASTGSAKQSRLNEMRALASLGDDEYQEAIRSGRVKDNYDIMAGSLPRDKRALYFSDREKQYLAREQMTQGLADWISPEPKPYAQPEGFLQKTGNFIANALPNVGAGIAEYSLLGGIPTAILNTVKGAEEANENVYVNKLNSGATHEEALDAANNKLGYIAQLGTQGATNAATTYFLGKAPTYNPLGASPYRQVLGNALGAVGSSMAGTAADEMIQNYRSDKENDYGEIAQNAGIAGLVTGGIAAFNAARNLGRINRLQDLYNKNRVYDIEGREIIPLGIEGGNEASSQGTNTPSTPNIPNTPSGLLPAETATTATRRINFNDTLARYGINGGANGSEAINNLAVAYTSRIISDNDLTNIANELQPSNPSAFESLIRERATTVEPLVKVEKTDIRSLLTPEVEHWTAENQNIKKPGVDIARGADFNRLLSPVNVTKPNLSSLMPQTEKIPLDTDFLQPTRQPITPVAEETKLDVTPLQPQQVQPTAEKQPKTQNGNVWEDPLKTRRTTTPVNDNQLPPYVSETIELMREAIRDVPEDDFRDYFLPKLYPNLPQTEIAKITKDDVIKDLYLQAKKTQSKGNLEIPVQQAQSAQNPTMGTVKNNAITPLGIQSEQPQQTPTSDENKVPEQPDYKNGTPEEWNEYYRKLYAYKLKEREKAELEARKKGKTFIPNVEDEKLLKNLERVVGEVEQQEANKDNGETNPIYNILTTDKNKKLTESEENEVRTLSEEIIRDINAMTSKFDNWKEREDSRAAVKVAIRDKLWGKLPDKLFYDNPDFFNTLYVEPILKYFLDDNDKKTDINKKSPSIIPLGGQAQQLPSSVDISHVPNEGKFEAPHRNIAKDEAISETPYKDRGANSDNSDKGSELWEKANKFNHQIGENNTQIQKIKEEIRGKLNINREYNLQELAQFPKEKAEIERLENENKTLEEQFEKYSRLSAIEKNYPKLGKFRVNEVKNGKKFLTFYISKSKKNQDLSIHEIGKGTNTSLETGIYSAESNILYLSQDYFEPRHSLVAFALGMADEEHISRDAEFGERVRDEFEKVLRKNHIYASPKIVKGLKNYRSGEEIHKQSVPPEAEKEQPKFNITEELLKKWGLEKHRGELIDNTTTQENKENNISKGQKQVTDKTNSTNSASEKVSASQQIAKTVSDFILRNYPTGENFTFSEEAVGNLDKLSNRDLFDIADSAFKGTQGQGKYTPKDAYDAMEMGINQAIIKLGIKADDKNNRKDLAKLSMMLKSLPTQANRTETQIEFQQFSTPPTLSYIANWLANIKDGETVLEPSAGLGGLVIYAKNAGAKIILNELEPRRAELLESMNLGKVYRENGEHIGDILATKISDSERPDKVIMNPPFSSTAGRIKGQRNSNNAIIHVQQALEILKDGGRLVAILGKGTTSKPAWKDIEAEYNVRAEINLDGSNYRKYGTSFDNMIVVIDKTGATPSGSTVKKDFKNLESIFEVQELKNIRNNITSTEKKEIKREYVTSFSFPLTSIYDRQGKLIKMFSLEGGYKDIFMTNNFMFFDKNGEYIGNYFDGQFYFKNDDFLNTLREATFKYYTPEIVKEYFDDGKGWGFDNAFKQAAEKCARRFIEKSKDSKDNKSERKWLDYKKWYLDKAVADEVIDDVIKIFSSKNSEDIVQTITPANETFTSEYYRKMRRLINAFIIEDFDVDCYGKLTASRMSQLKKMAQKIYYRKEALIKEYGDRLKEYIEKYNSQPIPEAQKLSNINPAPTHSQEEELPHPTPMSPDLLKQVPEKGVFTMTMGTYLEPTPHKEQIIFEKERYQNNEWWVIFRTRGGRSFASLAYEGTYVRSSGAIRRKGQRYYITDKEFLDLKEAFESYIEELSQEKLNEKLPVLESKQEDKHESKTEAPIKNKQEENSKKHSPEDKVLATEDGIEDPSLEEELVKKFKRAFDKLDNGRIYVKIPDLREALGWEHDMFDNVVKYLRDNGIATPHTGDASVDPRTKDYFYDENNIRFGTLSWNENNKNLKEATVTTPERTTNKPPVSNDTSEPISKRQQQPQTKSNKKEKKRTISEMAEVKGYKIKSKSKEDHVKERKADAKIEKKYYDIQDKENTDTPETQEISINSNYHPSISTGVEHPADLVESSAMASVSLPPLTYTPMLPAETIEEGKISSAQLEIVAYAGQAFSHELPDGRVQGFFIGDGTGVGKGREIAAIIQDCLAHGYGKGKAVWVSVKTTDLFKEAKEHWEAIGNDPDELFTQSDEKICPAKGDIKRDKDVLFTSYSLLNTAGRAPQLERWLGEDYDGIIVLDECHTANNATEQKGTRGMIAPSKISQIILSLVNKYPKAKILYSSATGATEVRNFALYDRLGLWGKDAPFDTKADFQEAINNGGLAGMEKLIMDLKAMGLYVSRSISYRAGPHGGDDDVTFSILEANITQEQRDTYNRIAEAWRVVERNLHKALQTCGVGEKGKGVELTTKPKEGDKTGANPYSLYRSLHQRVFNQIITSYKTDALIKDAKKQLANGKSVIIQLTTTNEAELKRAIERRMNERGIKSLKDIKGDGSFYDSLDYSPKFALTDFVLASFPIYQVEEYEEELSTGEKIKKIRQVQDSDGNPVVNQKALRIRDELLNDIGDFNYPQSPIDKIIDAFGVDNVAELTGRSERVITIDGKKQRQNITQTSKENDKELFLNGTIDKATGERVWKRILIFSKGGATGASYHAGRNFYNQQQRIHYILEAGWSASTAVQGMGRSHRTNQACKPHFVLVSSGIPGEKRFVSSIARRILQLGALTSGERKNASKGIFTEEDNLESKQARRAMDRVFGTLNKTSRGKQLIADMGLTEANSKNDEINIMTVFNRILALDIEDQESIFSIFGDYLKQEIYKAKEVGELDTRTENVKAESIKVLENQVIWESEKYNVDTRYIKLELQKKNKPRKWNELITGEKYFSLPNGDIEKRTYDRTNELEFYTNEDGQIFAVETTGDTQRIPSGEREGEEVPKVVVYSVEKKKRLTSNMAYFQNRWPRQQHKYTKVPNKEAKEIWEKQIKSMPPTYPEILHMITGLELPIWDKFSGVAPHLIRVTTDDGEIYLGRGVSDSRIGFLLDRFNIGKLKGNNKFTPETIRKYLSSGRKVIELSNGFTLQYSRVNGEMRLEIKGNVMSSTRERWGKDYGAIIEYINNKPRIFVPAEDDRLLEYILSQYNIVKESEKKWEEYEDNAISEINSGIPDGEVLNFLPKLFRFKSEMARDPENNPLLKTASPYSFVDEEVEERYLENKKARKLPGILQHIRDFGAKVWENRVDLPSLVGKEKFAKAVNILRELNLERRATVQEVVTAFRQILKDLTPDDFDLFERAMLVEDLAETIRLDEKAELPQGWTDETFLSDYENIKREVQKNKEVREAINKAEAYGEKLREDIIRESENLGFYTLRNKLRRKHYFRHLVMEYYEMANGGIKRPIVENIMNRGHYRKRKGSTMDINTDWIIAMGEVYTRMADDIKIMKALSKLREEYDVIDITKEHAISMNMELALADIKETLKNIPPDEINQKAIETLNSEINGVRSKAISRIFELAQKGDLPVGINNREWERLVERLAEAGQLENLTKKEINDFSRYIGWLVSNREGIFNQKGEVTAEPKKEAVRIIKGEAIRRKKLFEMLKERYITWQSLVPPNYEVFFPTHTGMIFSALSIPENLTQVAMRELEGELDIPISDIANMMSAGGLMQAWAIPSELAKTLKDFGAKQPLGSFGKVMKGLMSKFKKLTLLGPFNGRFAKYNIRNLLGDFEAVLQGNPGALLYVPQAIKELHKYIIEGAVPTGDLAEFVKRGGAITTEFSTALENWGDLTEFQNLIDKKKGTKISLWELPQKFILKPYMYYASLLTNFRESILRYAAFLSYKKLIDDNGGLPPFYGMSKKIEVDALKGNTYAMAFKLANENLGAYDEVSKDMQYLLDNNWVSFGAWLETCFTRTMQMYTNIITGSNYLEYYENKLIGKLITVLAGAGGGGKEPPNTSGISGLGFFDDDTPFFRNVIKNVKGIKNFSPKKAAVLIQRYINQLVLSFPLLIGALIINWLNSEDDKQLPPTVGTHLTLGRNPITNEIVYISEIGSMGQFFGLFPQIILLTGVKDLLDGKQTMRGLLSDTLSSPVNEILSNLNPLLKILTDTLYGKKMYPDFRNGSPIRNIPRYTAQTFNLGWWYDLLTGEPHSHFLNIASSLFNTAKADGSSSYHYIIGRKREFQEKFLGKSSGGFSSSTTGEQLRKARASLRYDDFEKTKESLRAYFQAGGTRQGLKQSISMLAPLSGLNDVQKKQFVKWLSEEDKEHLKRAMQYYRGVLEYRLKPKD